MNLSRKYSAHAELLLSSSHGRAVIQVVASFLASNQEILRSNAVLPSIESTAKLGVRPAEPIRAVLKAAVIV